MSDIQTRIIGRCGRITFTREAALNALSPAMSQAIETALIAWENDPQVTMLVIDAAGDRAFCAGGDIADIYRHGTKGNFDFARRFWAQEYRMNAKIANYPKPVAAFMQGFTMGGGVGVGCHGALRIVGESSQMAMPEVGIGLIPDVGGTLLLARAPGRLGEYLGLTAARMDGSDAIHAGFADHFIPEAAWPALIQALEQSGDPSLIAQAAQPPAPSKLAQNAPAINAAFAGETPQAILDALGDDPFSTSARKPLLRNAPLAMAATLRMIRNARAFTTLEEALTQEYCYTYRAQEQGDFLEGVRAQIIEKDRNPKWKHASLGDVSEAQINEMLAPLGAYSLDLTGENS
ncbi:MAG: enoyl-CoA hydratase/isomerase family protein [Paracoccaceae bacterium]